MVNEKSTAKEIELAAKNVSNVMDTLNKALYGMSFPELIQTLSHAEQKEE